MINTTPITHFTQTLRAAELSQQKEVKMTIQQARLLNLALSEIMDKLNNDYELKQSVNSDTITVQLDGGGFDQN